MSDKRGNPDDGGQHGTKEPSAKDKADLYVALGKSAQERFNVHHGVEWKIHFGLWTLFVAGAVFLTTQDTALRPSALECIFLSVLAGGLVAVYWLWWLPHSHKYREECTRSRWWWEACAWEELIPKEDRKLPDELRPGGWRVPSDENWQHWSDRGWIHVSHWMFAVVTVGFLLLFLAALWIRYAKSAGDSEGLIVASAAGILGGLIGSVIVGGAFYGVLCKRRESRNATR